MHRLRFRLVLLLALLPGSLGLLAAPGIGGRAAAADPRPGVRALLRAVQAQNRHTDRLLSIRGVVGTATIVPRRGQPAVLVFTRQAGVVGIPRELDGVPVVVEATGEFFALRWPPLRRAPRRWGRGRDRPPSVIITSPADGAGVSGEVTVTALAADDKGVQSVEVFADGLYVEKDEDGSDGWSVVWDTTLLADGRRAVTAVATDTSGKTGSDRIDVLVDNVEDPLSPAGRPAPIGVSTGNALECSAGTIGCRVTDGALVYALGNNHVYARLNRARRGEDIVQPGLVDSFCEIVYGDQVVGALADFVSIDFRPWRVNTVDAAIALTTPDDVGTGTPADGYGTPRASTVAASVGQAVQKYGRSTGLTFGEVIGINATVDVSYDARTARFVDQIIVGGDAGFILPGDSGSLLVTAPDKDPVGLLFAGNEAGDYAIANRIDLVLDALDVTIDGD